MPARPTAPEASTAEDAATLTISPETVCFIIVKEREFDANDVVTEPDPVVLALPRGGVPVAAEVAAALDAPLDLLLVRKMGVPFQPELAMGAVVDGDEPLIVRNEEVIRLADIDKADFQTVCDRELAEIEQARALFGRLRAGQGRGSHRYCG